MRTAMPATQRGLSFVGFIFSAILLVIVAIVGLKLVPAYVENAQISKIFSAIASDPEMQRASVSDIRTSFSKRASIDDVTVIKAEDIKIVNYGNRVVLSADYAVKLPLAGNVSLYLEFKPSSAE